MKFAEDSNTLKYYITACEPEYIKVNEKEYKQSLIVSNDVLLPNWAVKNISDLSAELLEPIFELQPELVLIGTGKKHEFLHPKFAAIFAKKHIGLEVMNTASACRTYNLLANDGRSVAAGLICR